MIDYVSKFIPEPQKLFDQLMETLPLRMHEVVVFGQRHYQPRQVCWHGPESFTYSGLTLDPDPWTDELLEVQALLLAHLGIEFNSVLVNHYRDGKDSVGWHADDEESFGPEPIIATISLGEPRLFCLKRKDGSERKRMILEGGSLFVMGKTVQRDWLHSVPKTKIPVGPRLSLTYRVWKPTP